jgi:hypothetical protein
VKSSDHFENIENHLSNRREAAGNKNNMMGFWPEKAWPLLGVADMSRAAEQAFETWRTVFKAHQAATEALYNTAQRQQALTFQLARSTLDACSARMTGGGDQQPNSSWTRVMAAYAEACTTGLEITQAMTSAAFEALQRTPALLAQGRTDGASAS